MVNPYGVSFQNIAVEVRDTKTKAHIKLLDGVSGQLHAGQLTALMGPSGSGKTTLLDVLSGRKTSGTISGSVQYGDTTTPSPAFLRANTGYVEQQPTLLAEFTVEEMLLYTAELRRPWSEPHSQTQAVVKQLINDLNLGSCATVLIGDPLRKGISGGQAKRVSIGVAMVCVPPVLYLDEPTSGLDSQSALEVMTLVRSATLGSTTVAAAVHSPGPELFALFDTAIVLAGGHVVYSGPTGSGYCMEYQILAGRWLGEVKDSGCLADLLLQAASSATSKGQAKELAGTFRQSSLSQPSSTYTNTYSNSLCGAAPSDIECPPVAKCNDRGNVTLVINSGTLDSSPASTSNGALPGTDSTATSAGNMFWFFSFLLLMKHRALRHWVQPHWYMTRLLDKWVFSIIIVSLYYSQGSKDGPDYVISITTSLFMWVTIPAAASISYTASFFSERPLYYRERADGLYRPLAYLLYKTLEELLAVGVIALTFSPIVFFVVDYRGSFIVYWLSYWLVICCSFLVAFAVSALSRTQDIANVCISISITACFFTAGSLVVLPLMPVYWRAFARINYTRYAWMALMLNQYEEHDPVVTLDGQNTLQWFHVDGHKWECVGILAGFIGVFFMLTWVALACVNHARR